MDESELDAMTKLEFLTCGNHTDAFLSQIAVRRLMLDSLGGDYASARLVLCVGGSERAPLPMRWQQHFERIEVVWAEGNEYRLHGDLAQSNLVYQLIDDLADISFVCDADTLLLRPLPSDFINTMTRHPALTGCIAHYPPPMIDFRSRPPQVISSARELWEILGQKTLGRRIDLPFHYTLQEEPEACPFYINLGFFAGTPSLFREYYPMYSALIPRVKEVLHNDFYEQIALTLAIESLTLPTRTLPIRFNFPNDPKADALYPDDAAGILNIHYLRTNAFDRHQIFSTEQGFDKFMSLPMAGSNAIFQERIREITGGVYPFPP